MKRIRPWLLLGGIWMSGCSTVPFPAPEPFAVEQGAREDVPVRFESHLAPTYEQVNAIVFRFRMREIAALGYAGKRIAVEHNGLIVPRSRHAATAIEAGDRIEIVVAVGGG